MPLADPLARAGRDGASFGVAALLLCGAALLPGCMSARLPASAAVSWAERTLYLQHLDTWRLSGRVAAALGGQGWQASLDWRESAADADVHLAGPLGIGALSLRRSPAGISLNGAAPSDTALTQVQERLGFVLPLEQLRFWLLGVPDPASAFDLQRNSQDRAVALTQAGWSIAYDRYAPVAGNLLPSRLVMTRDAVRVRIAIDTWELR